MSQHVLHSVLKAGQESAYDRDHAQVPEELVIALQDSGIRDWQIWRSGRNLFHLVECDDLAAVMATLADDPRNKRWQTYIGRYVDHFEPPDGDEGSGLPLVWQLSRQVPALT